MPNATSPRRSPSLDAHHRLAIAALLAAVSLIALGNRVEPATQIIVAWDVFAAVDLALAWRMILRADPAHLRETTRLQDSSRLAPAHGDLSFFFSVVILGLTISVMSGLL